MWNKKMRRPTDNPKDILLKVRLDQEASEKLNDCVRVPAVSKTEVMRRDVHKIHDGLKKK